VSHEERVQAVVIGGGVVGCAVLRELALDGVEALLLEAEPSIGEGTSKANSAIVHTGFDAKAGTVEATMLRRAAAIWPQLVEELSIPFLEIGALMLAREEGDRERLAEVSRGAAALGIETELLDAAAVRTLAPYVASDVRGALSIPGESIIDPFWLTRRLGEVGMAAGGSIWTNARVSSLSLGGTDVVVGIEDGRTVRAEQVFNCAGLWSDEVASLANDSSFRITPRRGQFLISEETFGVDRIVLPLPSRMGKGMLVTPIVFGGVLLGPTAEDMDDKSDRSTDANAANAIIAACAAMVPAVTEMRPIRQFAGLRPVSSTGDYILRPSTAGDRLFQVAGIRSTGISASPAIAEHVVAEVRALRGWARSRRTPATTETGFDAEAGAVVCVCRSVSSAEVRSAMRQQLPPTTLDAAKRACGTTFGDCQGNLCTVASAQLLASELGMATEQIIKNRDDSWLFLAGTPQTPPGRTARPVRPEVREADVIVVGGGLAGIGVALAAVESGLRPVVIERTQRWGGPIARVPEQLSEDERGALEAFERALTNGEALGWLDATVSGLIEEMSHWSVQIQDDGPGAELSARLVVLANGGYVEPREHRRIAGPRPSGVGTADLVHAALDAGLLPGRRAALVGSGRLADGTAARMSAAGMAVLRPEGEVTEIRGARRVEAVHAGDVWHEVDLLVLADRLVPAPFLLRPLGLVDNRPGMPAPTEPDGATALRGLWAAGTCRAPDVDHRGSLSDGRTVMRAAIARVEARQ
jgi:glycerol-3-phosphate dehydrogenase